MSEAAPYSGLRDRKKAQARLAILQAADRLFADRGYDQVTVADIAEAADLSVKTLFTYFRSKEDLILQDTRLIDALIVAVRDRPRLLTPAQAVADKLLELWSEGFTAYPRAPADNLAIQARLQRLWLEHEDRIAAELAREAGGSTPDAGARFQAAQIVLLIRACAWPEVQDLAANWAALEKWLKMTAWRLE